MPLLPPCERFWKLSAYLYDFGDGWGDTIKIGRSVDPSAPDRESAATALPRAAAAVGLCRAPRSTRGSKT
jgi:hypothetical protein